MDSKITMTTVAQVEQLDHELGTPSVPASWMDPPEPGESEASTTKLTLELADVALLHSPVLEFDITSSEIVGDALVLEINFYGDVPSRH